MTTIPTAFLTPPATPDRKPELQAADRDEKAMARLRNPFTAMADPEADPKKP
ncbi:hypothetical protein [Actinoplanes sp. NPDC051851]|uniref:hypothetical protein n=1 Tax=Actinoplanes sp. NPDC051851 TaxID=3154753 RepID=UPI0034263FE5